MVIVWFAVRSSTAKPHNPPTKMKAEKKNKKNRWGKIKAPSLGKAARIEMRPRRA